MPDTKLPDTNFPVTKFIVKHPEGKEARTRPCVHFITFGRDYGETEVFFPTVLTLDLSDHRPPPQHLCEEFTGLDKEIFDSFFAIPANEAMFHRALGKLRETVKLRPREGCVAFVINCTAGRHRSVAMAERLVREVDKVDGFKAECLHLDLEKALDAQAKRAARVGAAEVSENMPSQRRRRSRHKTQATSEAQVSEEKPREEVAKADAVLPAIEAPLRRKTVSWETMMPVGEPHFRQRETAGRSASAREKVENRSRRLSS